MTSTELDKHVQDWTEILYGAVPLETLNECYVEAFRRHRDAPFKANNVIAVWDEKKAGLPVIQSECMFCPNFTLTSDSSGIQIQGSTERCPFHGTQMEVAH